MHVIKRFEQALVWNPAGWLAAFSTNADLQRRLTLIGVALLLQTFTELPHDIIGAVAGQYAGLVTMVALAASLILLLYAVIAPPRAAKRNDAHLTRFVLIVGIVAASFGTMQIADAVYGSFTRVSYPNDGTTLSQNAAQLLLNGHDPYQDSSIVAALRRYQQGGEFTTPVRTGRFAGRSWLDYPYSCVSMAWQMGRSGLGAQHRRTSEMRPKRASSWNIILMALPCAQSLRMVASVSGSFFSTPLEPVDHFADDACRGQAFSSCGGAVGYRPMPAPPLVPGARPAPL